MTNTNTLTVDLGPTSQSTTFDDAFFDAKRVFDSFEVDVVTFTFFGATVTIDATTTVGEAFDQTIAGVR